MAYRQPQSTIYLFKGCPCDTEYNNTLYFSSKAQQLAYFKTLPYIALSAQSYQRYEKGTLRIYNSALTTQAGTDSLYDYNYMMFCNDGNFSINTTPTNNTKMFYCFIEKPEYINENSTQIEYVIDYVQTYMFDYKLGDCFVEREHSISDEIGENLIEEPFNPKLYTDNQIGTKLYNHQCVQIRYTPNFKSEKFMAEYFSLITRWFYESSSADTPSIIIGTPTEESVINRVPTADFLITIPITTFFTPRKLAKAIYTFIDQIVKTNGTITDLLVLPYELCPEYCEELGLGSYSHPLWQNIDMTNPVDCLEYLNSFSASTTEYYSVNKPTAFYDNQGNAYTPTNKKMYSYPYQKIAITNSNGEHQEFAPEMFNTNNNELNFKIIGCSHPIPEITMFPYNYNQMEQNLDRQVTMNNFCSGTWSEDSASRYWSENKNKIALGLIGGAVMLAGSAGLGISSVAVAPSLAAFGMSASMGASAIYPNIAQGQNLLPAGNEHVIKSINVPTLTANPNPLMAKLGAMAIGHQIANIMDMFNKQDNVMGKASNSNNAYFANCNGFKIIYHGIMAYDAKRIDHYFSMFGYAVKDIKVPNLYDESVTPLEDLRPKWNYLKNVYTQILPYKENNTVRFIPEDAEHALKQIYNNGITFWMVQNFTSNEEVGDYSMDNSPQ